MQTENVLAAAADQQSVYTPTAFSYYNQLITTPNATSPTAPSNLTASPGFTTASLSWDPSTDNIGVAGYNLYRCTPPAAGQPCTGTWLDITTLPDYSDSSLTGGTLYNYQVQAFDFAGNNSALSPAISLQTYLTSASSATNLVATAISAQEIDLSWSPPSSTEGLSQYLIFAGASAASVQQIAVRPSTQTTYRDMNLAPGASYYFGIVAVEQGIDAPMTSPVSAATLPLPNPPSNVTGAPAPTNVVLNWQEDPQAGGLLISYYEIFEGTAPGNMIDIGATTAPPYISASLTANTTYYFEIVAVDTGHDSSAPSGQIAVATLALPAAPVNVMATANSAIQVTVTWLGSIPPNGLPILNYNILRGTSPTGLAQVAGRTAPPFFDTTVAASAMYYYAIQAVDTAGDVSSTSAVAQVTTPSLPAAPAGVAATANSATSVTVTWSESIPPNGLPILGYNIFRGTSPGGLTQLAAQTAAPFFDTGASASTTFYYAVEAVDTGGDVSPMSATAQITTPALPAAPVAVAATAISATRVIIFWSESVPPNALPIQNYNVFRGTSPTGMVQVASRTRLHYFDPSASPSTTYYYAIQAVDTGGDVSTMSAAAMVTTPALPAAPVDVEPTADSATQVTITWSETIPPNGLPIQYYNIFRGTSPTGLTRIAGWALSPFIDTSTSPNTTYYYGIEAVDTGGGVSPLSAAAEVTTPSY